MGDLALDAKVSLADRRAARRRPRARRSPRAPDRRRRQLPRRRAAPSPSAGSALAVGHRVVAAANLGLEVAQRQDLPDGTAWGTRIRYAAGISVPASDALWASLELDGERLVATSDVPRIDARGGAPRRSLRPERRHDRDRRWRRRDHGRHRRARRAIRRSAELRAARARARPRRESVPTVDRGRRTRPARSPSISRMPRASRSRGRSTCSAIRSSVFRVEGGERTEPLPAGTHELLLSAPGYGAVRRTVTIDPGAGRRSIAVLAKSRDRRRGRADPRDREDLLRARLVGHRSRQLRDPRRGRRQHPRQPDHRAPRGAGPHRRPGRRCVQPRAQSEACGGGADLPPPGGRRRVKARGSRLRRDRGPLQPGTSEDVRASNRRVEFHIVRTVEPPR